MMKRLFPFVASAVLVGCSTTGNIVKTDNPDQFLILIHSNMFSNAEKRENLFNKKAGKACKGRSFEKIDDASYKQSRIYTQYGYTSTSTKKQVIQCK